MNIPIFLCCSYIMLYHVISQSSLDRKMFVLSWWNPRWRRHGASSSRSIIRTGSAIRKSQVVKVFSCLGGFFLAFLWFVDDLWMLKKMMLKNDEKRWWNSLRKSLRNVNFRWTLMKWGGLPLMKLPNSIKFSVTSWKVSGFRHIPNHSSVDPLFTSLLELKGSRSSVSSRK